jgi:hypothetical protein
MNSINLSPELALKLKQGLEDITNHIQNDDQTVKPSVPRNSYGWYRQGVLDYVDFTFTGEAQIIREYRKLNKADAESICKDFESGKILFYELLDQLDESVVTFLDMLRALPPSRRIDIMGINVEELNTHLEVERLMKIDLVKKLFAKNWRDREEGSYVNLNIKIYNEIRFGLAMSAKQIIEAFEAGKLDVLKHYDRIANYFKDEVITTSHD